MTEATARIKINKLLEAAGWRFFANESGHANICLEGTSNNCALAIVDQIGFKDRTRFGSGGGFDGAVRFL